jgi:glutaredoxin
MEFDEPLTIGFTIYSKSGCHNCNKIKNLLTEKHLFFNEVQCDEYLIEEKEDFLSFIENKIGRSYTTFPMVFYDGKFIGGFNEATEHIEKLLLSFEDLF